MCVCVCVCVCACACACVRVCVLCVCVCVVCVLCALHVRIWIVPISCEFLLIKEFLIFIVLVYSHMRLETGEFTVT